MKTLLALLAAVVIVSQTTVTPPTTGSVTAEFSAYPVQGSTCVAPCAIYFDGFGEGGLSSPTPYVSKETVDTVYTNEWATLQFYWDFDDNTANSCGGANATWEHDGRPKWTDIGPTAGHLYCEPGTYHPTLYVTNPAGEVSSKTETVTVADPDTEFSTALTFCIANDDTDWTGCPLAVGSACTDDNCTVITTAQDARAQLESGDNCSGTDDCPNIDGQKSRVLFRRGDRFNLGILDNWDWYSSSAPGLAEDFGNAAAAKPILNKNANTMNVRRGWTFKNIHIEGRDSPTQMVGYADGSNITFYNSELHQTGTAIGVPYLQQGDASQTPIAARLGAFIDSDIVWDDASGNGGTMMFHYSTYYLWLGGTVDRNGNISFSNDSNRFTFRWEQVQNMVMKHAEFKGEDTGPFVVRTYEDNGVYDDTQALSRLNMSQNIFTIGAVGYGGDTSVGNVIKTCSDSGCNCQNGDGGTLPDGCGCPGAPGTCGGQGSSGGIEEIYDILIDGNLIRLGPGVTRAQAFGSGIFDLEGGFTTVRNNVIDLNTSFSGGSLNFAVIRGEVPHQEGGGTKDSVHIMNNTVFADISGYSGTMRDVTLNTTDGATPCVTDCLVKNNLYVVRTLSGGTLGQVTGNFTMSNVGQDSDGIDPFDGTMPTPGTSMMSDFVPSSGETGIIDAGFNFGSVTSYAMPHDGRGLCRYTGSGWDIGAIERDAGECP